MADNPAKISPKTRSRVYVSCLIVNVISVVGFGLSTVFGWLSAEDAAAAGGVIISGINIVATGLAVNFRPTKSVTR